MLTRLSLPAIAAGAVLAMGIGGAATIALLLADPVDGSNWWLLGSLGALIGFFAGGARAGRAVADRPMTHGAVAAFAAFFILQTLGTLRRLAAGDEVSWLAYPFRSLLAATTGLLGALFGVAMLTRGERMAARDERPGG